LISIAVKIDITKLYQSVDIVRVGSYFLFQGNYPVGLLLRGDG